MQLNEYLTSIGLEIQNAMSEGGKTYHGLSIELTKVSWYSFEPFDYDRILDCLHKRQEAIGSKCVEVPVTAAEMISHLADKYEWCVGVGTLHRDVIIRGMIGSTGMDKYWDKPRGFTQANRTGVLATILRIYKREYMRDGKGSFFWIKHWTGVDRRTMSLLQQLESHVMATRGIGVLEKVAQK